jgi:hypothetical protein
MNKDKIKTALFIYDTSLYPKDIDFVLQELIYNDEYLSVSDLQSLIYNLYDYDIPMSTLHKLIDTLDLCGIVDTFTVPGIGKHVCYIESSVLNDDSFVCW